MNKYGVAFGKDGHCMTGAKLLMGAIQGCVLVGGDDRNVSGVVQEVAEDRYAERAFDHHDTDRPP